MTDADAAVHETLAGSPYARALGVRLDELAPGHARLRLPYRDENSNPGKALHGGCAASLAVLGGHGLAHAALGPGSGPWHTCGLQVSYLAAALGEDVVADARLLRRGKEMCFVEVDVATSEGKPTAHATLAVRGRFGAADAEPPRAAGDDGAADPGPLGPHIERVPFIAGRSIHVEHMAGGCSRLTLAATPENAEADGHVHEGAVLALLDTTGAMAAWAVTGPGRYKASTPALQAQILTPPPSSGLVAYGRSLARDGEIFFSEVEVASAASGRLCARGTVIYRIVV